MLRAQGKSSYIIIIHHYRPEGDRLMGGNKKIELTKLLAPAAKPIPATPKTPQKIDLEPNILALLLPPAPIKIK